MRLIALLPIVALAACATFSDPTKITVGANSFAVAQATDRKDTWIAVAMQGSDLLGNARFIGASKAIEKVSGCKVIPETITHHSAMMMAAVKCAK